VIVYVVRQCVVAACCVAASASLLVAQVAGGQMTGTVTDQAGAAVPGATVTVTQLETNRQRIVTSSSNGVYATANLAPGDYRVDIALSGFKSMRRGYW
jgi:protocatechuate 3,4-dioxygenase beta subunit